jgi:hypothetical protein
VIDVFKLGITSGSLQAYARPKEGETKKEIEAEILVT